MDFIGAAKSFIDIFVSLISQKEKRDEKYDDALKAVLIAVNKTRSYLRYLENNYPNHNKEEVLAELWVDASVKLRKIDRNLAFDCHKTSYYWANPYAEMHEKVKRLDSIHEDCMELLFPTSKKLTNGDLLTLGLSSYSSDEESDPEYLGPDSDSMLKKIFLLNQTVSEINRLCFSDRPSSVSIMFIDLDDFTKINSVFTDEIGDRVLTVVEQIINDKFPKCRVFKLTGDEFVLYLKDYSEEQAYVTARQIRMAVKNYDWHLIAVSLFVTSSIGLAQLKSAEQISECLLRALYALEKVKNAGGNGVRKSPKKIPWGSVEATRQAKYIIELLARGLS